MRVLLTDDHSLFMEGMKTLMMARGIDVVGTACDGHEALEKARALQPDIIVMDVQMPGCDGLTATRQIKAEFPDIQIVILSVSEDDEHIFEAIRSGASGYILKRLDANTFFDLLDGLEKGEVAFSPGLAAKILKEFAAQSSPKNEIETKDHIQQQLTPRQSDVLTQVAQGLTYKEIGIALAISERTVKHHMREILDRLHLKNRAEAVAFAQQAGWGQETGGDPKR